MLGEVVSELATFSCKAIAYSVFRCPVLGLVEAIRNALVVISHGWLAEEGTEAVEKWGHSVVLTWGGCEQF